MIAQFPKSGIPTEIPESNQGCYNFVGLRAKQGKGLNQELQVKLFTKTVEDWNAMSDSLKTPKNIGNFSQVILIHDPFVIEEKKGRVTDAKKTRINKLMEAGQGQDDAGLHAISDEVGLSFQQVKNYIKSF